MTKNDQELKSLMRDIENDAIDKSQWIPRKETAEIINNHHKRNIGNQTIADILILKGFIDARHKDYGLDYLELRNAVFGALNAKTSAFMLFMGDTSLRRSNASMIYETVSKAMGRDAEGFIERALTQPSNDSLRYEFVANVYRAAFEILEKEIDLALKKISEQEKGVANAE